MSANGKTALMGVKCLDCGKVLVAPAWACTDCGSDKIGEEMPLCGKGTVVTHTVVRRPSPGFPDAPYMVVVVKMEEGVEIPGWLAGFENESVQVGTPVRFSHFDHRNIPQFRVLHEG